MSKVFQKARAGCQGLSSAQRTLIRGPNTTSPKRKFSSKQGTTFQGNKALVYGLVGGGTLGLGLLLSNSIENEANQSASSGGSMLGTVYGYLARFGIMSRATDQKFYQEVYDNIADILEEDTSYDDGSYGPILVRLAWHASGTFEKSSSNGGSCGATMRYEEGQHGANAGLKVARDLMERIKAKFPEISYSDLWTLAGVAAIQEMGGPTIKWRPGRSDEKPSSERPPDGRLPDASKDQHHVRQVFQRMGFNDQETVALIGAHALGRCHSDRSGFDGPWTFSPTMFTNDFFVKLVEEKWQVKSWQGPKQFEDKSSKSLMMLPTDMSLLDDAAYKKVVHAYAKDQDTFFKDFSQAFSKLLELGFAFNPAQPAYEFKSRTN